ncbi:carboxymuconolactone decarboxylase family protein [Paraburkholderia sp. MM5384-R2]|uniref:carboxymuconolactone decarboxylase family protein n=1 Tax=Paraburkholderia sp. MM5384-R2 TaxID=2723097 RepID=UPI001622E7D2|nr:carboxymuconolactone decarboxylase family protein [Paraburkholderia sp. MM5384-R2]MBB5498813.1 4-carboxymuconolactone decarboxylase [Paraburkholderia sp. MM5384-R2]
MTRLKTLTEKEMTPEQQTVCDEVSSGPRGKVPLPMFAWLRNPELARRVQDLGALLRYDITLEPRLVELAILVCARYWTTHVQWKAHKVYAIRDGLDPQVAADIAARRTPRFGDDEAGNLIYNVSNTLLNTGRVPVELYGRATAHFGERGIVELCSLLGYYCLASFTLNTFELGLPESAVPELEDPEYPSTVAVP